MPAKRKDERRKGFEGCFFLEVHCVLLGRATRGVVVRMNQRNDPFEQQVAKGVIADRACRFRGEPPIPKARIESITNFNLGASLYFLMQKPTVANKGL